MQTKTMPSNGRNKTLLNTKPLTVPDEIDAGGCTISVAWKCLDRQKRVLFLYSARIPALALPLRFAIQLFHASLRNLLYPLSTYYDQVFSRPLIL